MRGCGLEARRTGSGGQGEQRWQGQGSGFGSEPEPRLELDPGSELELLAATCCLVLEFKTGSFNFPY